MIFRAIPPVSCAAASWWPIARSRWARHDAPPLPSRTRIKEAGLSTGLKQPVYIAGVAETPLGKVPDHTEMSMLAVAAREATAEAGMSLKDIDGVFCNYMGEEGSVQVGEYLGLQPRYSDSSDLGGAAFEIYVHHAMLAVAE